MSNDIFEQEIKKWLNNAENTKNYREAISSLERSGLLVILQKMSTPNIIENGANVHTMAGQAHWSNGYAKCLEHLRYFIPLFNKEPQRAIQSPDFGGTASALAKGDLRPSDLK